MNCFQLYECLPAEQLYNYENLPHIQVINDAAEQKVVVVSAMGSSKESPVKVTDLILNMIDKAARQDAAFLVDLAALQEKHVETAKKLLGQGPELTAFVSRLMDDIGNLKAMLQAICIGAYASMGLRCSRTTSASCSEGYACLDMLLLHYNVLQRLIVCCQVLAVSHDDAIRPASQCAQVNLRMSGAYAYVLCFHLSCSWYGHRRFCRLCCRTW